MCLHFLNRSIPFFPKTDVLLKPREQSFIKIDVPSIDEISELDMTKLPNLKTCTNSMKVKFFRNTGYHDVTNNSLEMLIFSKDKALGAVDMRSIGYFKVKHSTIQHNTHYYEFQPLQVPCEEFNNMTNTIKREEQQSTDPYPW